MKILVSADIHNHLFNAFALNDDSTGNSRLKAIVDVLNQMYDYAIANKVEVILLNGDIFEEKDVVKALVNNIFWDWCIKVGEANIQLILNVGNHDIAALQDETITLLHPYKKLANVHVIDKPTIFAQDFFDGFANAVIIPFRRDVTKCKTAIAQCLEEIDKNPDNKYRGESDPIKLLFYHGAIYGAKLTTREFLDEKNSLSTVDIQSDKFDFVFLGHFHTRQLIGGNVLYSGSPLHHTMSDAGQERGFDVIDLRTFNITFVPTKFPRFHNIKITSREDLKKIDMIHSSDYYDIDVLTPDVREDELKHISELYNTKVSFDTHQQAVTRLESANDVFNLNISSIIDEYIDKQYDKKSKTERDKLKRMGKDYVSKVTQMA